MEERKKGNGSGKEGKREKERREMGEGKRNRNWEFTAVLEINLVSLNNPV